MNKWSRKLVCLDSDDNASVRLAQTCVRNGADIFVTGPERFALPALHKWLSEGKVGLTFACLQTASAIDWRVKGGVYGRNPIHCLCFPCASPPVPVVVMALLQAICFRLANYPTDVVDWGARDYTGMNVWDLITERGLLSLAFPILTKHVSLQLLGPTTPVPLLLKPDEKDWSHVSEECRAFFSFPSQDSSIRLWRLQLLDSRDMAAAQRYIARGADVCYLGSGRPWPVLHNWMYNGDIMLVKACLESPNPIDFTVLDDYSGTPLHNIFYSLGKTADVVIELIKAVLHRLRTHPDDRVDWGQGTKRGTDFLSLAASTLFLSVVYPLVKHLPYYANRSEPFPLRCHVSEKDWNALSSEDQDRLLPLPVR